MADNTSSRPRGGGGGGGGGSGRNRNSRKRGNTNNPTSSSNSQGSANNSIKRKQNYHHHHHSKKPTVAPPPQMKLTIRNIGNEEFHGSVQKLLELISKLVESTNNGVANAVNTFSIEMDSNATRRLIQEEQLVHAALQQQQKQQLKESAATAETSLEETSEKQRQAEGEKANDDSNKKEEQQQQAQDSQKDLSTTNALEVVVAPKKPSSVPTLSLRPLYAIPPKKTRRRGERAGIMYLVLTAPKLDFFMKETNAGGLMKPQDLQVVVNEPINESVRTQTSENHEENHEGEIPLKEQEQNGIESAKALDGITSLSECTGEDGKAMQDSPPELVSEFKGESESTPVEKTNSTTPPGPPAPAPSFTPVAAIAVAPTVPHSPSPAAEHSRAVAKGRLLLVQAMEALTVTARDDARGPQLFAGCIVEPSMSGKTWRQQYHRPDRREGTIESTADFKQWLQSLAKLEEDLKARPKPAPGGGSTSAGSNPDGSGEANAGPVAAIVMHLRAKREESKRKKAKKKKEKVDKTKGKKSKKDSSSSSNKRTASKPNDKVSRGGGGGARDDPAAGKKKKKKPVKKKTGGKVGVAPTGVLKPPGEKHAGQAPSVR